jgi:hypothetical protein
MMREYVTKEQLDKIINIEYKMKIVLVSKDNQRLIISCNENDDPKKVSDEWLNNHLDYKMYDYKIEEVINEA